MADIRINALATTAASTASDDFVAVDGSANGTRKLNAYSPTFGGNLTVSGTGGITSSSISPLLKATSSALGSAPKLTLENTNLGAWNVYLSGTDGGDFKIDQDSTNKFRIAYGTGNATLAGNLTVSGTGTSSFAGPLNVTASSLGTFTSSTANATSGEQAFTIKGSNNSTSTNFGSSRAPSLVLWNNSGAANSYAALVFQDGGGNAVAGVQGLFIDDATNHGALTFWSRAASGSYAEAGRFTGSGNLLLKSDGIDSANGKLQLADHTTSAGGIGFGTDSYLYRRGVGEFVLGSATNAVLDLDSSAGNTQAFIFKKAGVETARIATPGSSSSLIFYTGSAVTALTLDSSQNATFAGDIRFSSANSFDIGQTGTRVRTAFIKTLVLTSGAPAAANSTGTAGTVTWDANYLYVCTATDTWKRVAIATWP